MYTVYDAIILVVQLIKKKPIKVGKKSIPENLFYKKIKTLTFVVLASFYM